MLEMRSTLSIDLCHPRSDLTQGSAVSNAKALTLFDVGRLEGRSPPDDLVVARSRSPPTATKLAS